MSVFYRPPLLPPPTVSPWTQGNELRAVIYSLHSTHHCSLWNLEAQHGRRVMASGFEHHVSRGTRLEISRTSSRLRTRATNRSHCSVPTATVASLRNFSFRSSAVIERSMWTHSVYVSPEVSRTVTRAPRGFVFCHSCSISSSTYIWILLLKSMILGSM